ncbi:MAG: TRAP transporter substrate-binding protein DctP [Thermodesulfobacteriota bacterium]|nr:TRAP transporter substrate-binding protein DctP [Thermodesulfobacteriota bacterium]
MFLKKIGFAFLSLFFVCGVLITGGQQQAKAKELKFILASYVPPSYKDLFPPIQGFADYVNEHGKGRVHVEHYHSGTLLKAKELLPGLMQGTADMVLQLDAYIMGTYPILGITELPFLYESMEASYVKLGVDSPLFELMNQELAKKNLFAIGGWPILPEYIWTKDRPIRKPDDLKGLRIRVAGRVEARVIKTLGAAPTATSSAELYEALKRGTVDGALCTWSTIPARGLQDTLKYVTKASFAAYSGAIYIRLDRWKALPPDIKELFLEAGKTFGKGVFDYSIPYWEANTWPIIRKGGITEIELTQAEEEEFKKRIKPVWDWWKGLLPPGVGEKAIKLATE